jgi:hypothetical protein
MSEIILKLLVRKKVTLTNEKDHLVASTLHRGILLLSYKNKGDYYKMGNIMDEIKSLKCLFLIICPYPAMLLCT